MFYFQLYKSIFFNSGIVFPVIADNSRSVMFNLRPYRSRICSFVIVCPLFVADSFENMQCGIDPKNYKWNQNQNCVCSLYIHFLPLFLHWTPQCMLAYYSKKLGITRAWGEIFAIMRILHNMRTCQQCLQPNAPPIIARPKQLGVLYIAGTMRPLEPNKPNGAA